ncbi:DUF309 domain-containing protein [Halobacillus litoralis]|uniref:DUF309 domain-containing protein n=1 Tax=Halobacillus litoralis TaxID=45668 RepID=UPI001CFD5167|nr:DUF309 domain-containing protein [Halobacillus litoralis]
MYPKPYIEFLAHFHGTRDYFECHEVLEAHWKSVDPKNRASVWVTLIQIAVAMYHDRRGNQKGALTLINRCINRVPDLKNEIDELGIDSDVLFQRLAGIRERLEERKPYRSWNFPIVSLDVSKEAQLLCQQWRVAYGSPSNLADQSLVLKHKYRR